MNYVWESVGDQDACLRKVCYLGPYLLEHVEEGLARGGGFVMASYVYLWNDQSKIPELIAELPATTYVPKESYRVLEDWYALNVLSEELFTGKSDG